MMRKQVKNREMLWQRRDGSVDEVLAASYQRGRGNDVRRVLVVPITQGCQRY